MSTLTRARLAARSSRLPEIAVLLLAIVTRFWRLGYHSIWFDEAVSLEWAGADIVYTWDVTLDLVQEKHPPLYYIFLHIWQEVLKLFGLDRSDAALRASGALLGVLTVLGLLLLVRRLSGRRVALLAGLLAALSPLLVWYSQELRMFQPAATALVWGSWFLLRAWESRRASSRIGWWLAMAAALLAALYSYLFSALALPAAGLSLFVLWARDRRGGPLGLQRPVLRLVEGTAALALVGLLFLPLARNAWLVNSSEGTPAAAFAGFGATTFHLLKVFTVWKPGWPEWLAAAVALLAGALALCGLLLPDARPSHRTDWTDRLWLLIWLGVPYLIGNLLLATSDSVFAEDRYFVYLAPFLLWAAARGTVRLYERMAPAGLITGVVLATALAASLPALWTPAMYREQWRAAAALIAEHTVASPGLPAAVIAHVDYTHMPLEWYLRQRFSFDELPVYFPFGGVLTEDQIDDTIAPPLAGVEKAGFDTLWLTQSHLEGLDDQRLVQRWLDEHYPLVTEAFPAGVEVRAYATRSYFEGLPEGVKGQPVAVIPGLTLAACEVTTPRVSAAEHTLHPPSGWVHVRMWWQGDGTPPEEFAARVRVVDDSGVWGESLARAGGVYQFVPESAWEAGSFVRDEQDVNLNPAAPPGRYRVTVKLRDAGGTELGSETPCGEVLVTR